MVSLRFRVSTASVRLFGVVEADEEQAAEVGRQRSPLLKDFQA
jgi:hypothetical protein